MFFLSDIHTSNYRKSKDEKRKPNYIAGAGYAAGAGLVGQQAIRSGIPRSLGVRLESHSTSRKNAKAILNSGGYLNPELGGTGVTKDLVGSADKVNYQIKNGKLNKSTNQDFINRAKKNVYITGRSPGYSGEGNNVGNISKSLYNNPVGEQIYKKWQRAFYRGQSELPFNQKEIDSKLSNWKQEVDYEGRRSKAKDNIKNITKELEKMKKVKPSNMDTAGRKKKQLLKELQSNQNTIRSTGKQRKTTINNIKEQIVNKRKPESLARGVFGGRSLYVGGGDDYFKDNFAPDPDDILAMKTNKPIKVFGSRFAATRDALKRYGNGNAFKGAAKLMGANKGRVAAGLGILGAGALATGYLANKARQAFTGDSQVKAHTRRSKSGKLTSVKSFTKKRNNA